MTRINNPYTYFKYFVLILPFLLLSCGSTDLVSPPDTKTYTVTFNTNGGSEILSQTINKGGKAVKPANDPTNGNLIFGGWTTVAYGTGDAFDFDTVVTKDLMLYAIWGFEVTFDTNGGSEIPSQTIAVIGKIIKPMNDPTKSGQTFVGWSTTADGTGDAFNFDILVNNDLTLYAIWIAKTYTVTFNTNGGSETPSQTIAEGEKIIKPTSDPTRSGQTFVRWTTNADGTGGVFDFNTAVTSNLTLYAIWIAKTYTVTFETNGGGSAIDNQTIAEGEKIVKPANDPTRGNLTFVGWTTTADGTGEAFDFNTAVTTDLTLYAIWGFEIAFDTNGGSAIDNQTIAEGKKIVKPTNDPTKSGQNFVKWSITADGTGDTFNFDTAVTEDLTLYAIWGDGTKPYTITFDTNGGSDVDSQTIAKGGKIVKPTNDPTKSGQTFVGWFANLASAGEVFDFNIVVNNDLTLYAIWIAKTYTVTFNTNGGSEIPNQTITEGEKIIKPTNDPTKSGQVFVKWTATAADTGEVFDFDTAVTEDLTLYAIWNVKTYIVTFNTNGGSEIPNQTIAEGEKIIKPTSDPTKSGQAFVGWTATTADTGEVFDFDTAVTEDLTLYAIWGFEVVFNTNGGSETPSQTIDEGEKIIKPTSDPTKSGQTFVRWTTNAAGTGDTFNFDTAVTENITLYAIWIAKTYTVTFETNGGDAVSEQKTKGSKVTFIDTNQASKAFIWWYTSPTFEVSTRYDFDKAVTENITLYARWDEASIYTMSENKITFIKFPSEILEIPYSVDGSLVTAVEGEEYRSIFGSTIRRKNTTVKQVILPNSIKNIGDFAFYSCTALKSINIPDSVTSIGTNAFNSSSLSSVTIPDSVTSISNGVFNSCRYLKSITIPDSVTSIGDSAFSGCDFLKSITIPDSVTSIGDYTFSRCSILTSITIPNSVTSIGVSAFDNCISLTSITIPDSVTSIGLNAFLACTALTSVTIPDSVTSIGAGAFANCTQLASVRVEAITPPPIIKEGTLGGLDIFRNTPSSLSITVPAASLEAYKTNTFWSPYADRITGY